MGQLHLKVEPLPGVESTQIRPRDCASAQSCADPGQFCRDTKDTKSVSLRHRNNTDAA